jgi:hypothetical protein
MDIDEFKKVLTEFSEHPESLNTADTKLEKVLKEIIKIERRYLYGLDSTSIHKRRSAIFEYLNQELKNRDR